MTKSSEIYEIKYSTQVVEQQYQYLVDEQKCAQTEHRFGTIKGKYALYRFWHFATGEDSKDIYRQAPAETMSRNWLIFHTLAPEVAIEDLKEIYRQKNSN